MQGSAMNIRVQKIFEGLYALEELREIYRHALPTGLDADEEAGIRSEDRGAGGDRCRGQGRHGPTVGSRRSRGLIELRTREEQAINIDPIQAAGGGSRSRP